MELHQQFAHLLRQYQQSHPRLLGWRFDLHQTRGLVIGVKNNRIGGPYSTPGYKQSISGELYLIWEGQHFTSSKLDAQVVAHFDEYMELWLRTAYHDPEGVGLYQPGELPRVPLADTRAGQVANGDFQQAFDLLNRGLDELTAAGIQKVDAKCKCFESQRFMMNSEGLEVSYPQTPIDFYFIANDSYGEGFDEKHWPVETEINRVIANTARIGKLLQQNSNAKLSGPVTLILPPGTFESLLSHFLLTNLHGSLVVNRQSRYTAADFAGHKPVLREDLSLVVNPLLPYRSFSYNCTAEAVPARTQAFIERGRLITPVLNLKYARKMGLEPTSAIGGGFFVQTDQTLEDWETVIGQIDRGLIVYSVLGLHTQDASSGQFSLTADQCLMVENGQITGKVKAVINGDFLASLLKSESRLCKVEGEDNPGYLFEANALS